MRTSTLMATQVATQVIPLDAPDLGGNERRYLNECIDTNWISWQGRFGRRLEQSIAAYCRTRHALAVVNGTQALVLALQALDVGPGDEVIVPTLNFSGNVFAVTAVGATPVFVDTEKNRFTLDPDEVARKLTPRTKAVMAVHLYGWTVDMTRLLAVTPAGRVHVVEDVAEAFSATDGGRFVGGIGTIGCHSFHNKIIASGEGGAITVNDELLFARLDKMRTPPPDNSGSDRLVLNNRMSNLASAVALAQLERVDALVEARRRIAGIYDERFRDSLGVRIFRERSGERAAYWRYQLYLTDRYRLNPTRLAAALKQDGIEGRPVFTLMHEHPMYRGAGTEGFERARELSSRCIDLPSGPTLTDEQVHRVADSVLRHGAE